ncbi:2-succinyl-6-hydroxy-2,4-cyclohexadiene-1-carboxylate synthase [Photobacterium phosphoreum]|uniref:alpha/beta fold hydrolase n=1 Tax=Photobacterium phosphoreum TaxID=659 RepID=UPI000D1617A0|nr:alpha/beta fold hydrolase [Photobacterium phosphoreum]MCD9506490.1 alpha/beta fold hydrolase [Photobacterium phosphoreum]PSU71397.1 2-succinyl-6-hydroxy-2,4-cyclohexadiene-1-carboxylate synthase [Photobacterium phosphoreum]PSW16988.1 2-succinyl-6-hydroxy-2,4-cyclohexadiene-1-carboxylate synthase [Photobacterium phosphoreum]
MQTFAIDGQQMTYRDQGTGPVLVFGHSYLWDSAMWAPQIAVLSQHYRCIVPDFWAHGGSDSAPLATRTLRDYADDVLALLDHLEIEQFAVIGLSVGGMWGAELALKAPTRVMALVLMDTFLGYEPEVLHTRYFAMLDTLRDQQHVPTAVIDMIAPLFFRRDGHLHNPQLVSNFRNYLSELRGERAVAVSEMGRMVFGRRDTFDDIEQLTVPTLIMSGLEDNPRPPLEAQLMHDAIDGSEYVLIPEAGHISNLEQPQFVTAQLQRFLSKVLSA